MTSENTMSATQIDRELKRLSGELLNGNKDLEVISRYHELVFIRWGKIHPNTAV